MNIMYIYIYMYVICMALYSHAKPYKSVLTSPCRMEPRCRFSTSMVKRTINAALCLDSAAVAFCGVKKQLKVPRFTPKRRCGMLVAIGP